MSRAVLPVAGGGYLRLYPLAITRWAIERLNRREGCPAIVYIHPWEIDPEQDRIKAPLINRFRHYYGLRSTERKLRDLMVRYRFGTVSDVIAETTAVDPELAPDSGAAR